MNAVFRTILLYAFFRRDHLHMARKKKKKEKYNIRINCNGN